MQRALERRAGEAAGGAGLFGVRRLVGVDGHLDAGGLSARLAVRCSARSACGSTNL